MVRTVRGRPPAAHRRTHAAGAQLPRAEHLSALPESLPGCALPTRRNHPLQTLATALADVRVTVGESMEPCPEPHPSTRQRVSLTLLCKRATFWWKRCQAVRRSHRRRRGSAWRLPINRSFAGQRAFPDCDPFATMSEEQVGGHESALPSKPWSAVPQKSLGGTPGAPAQHHRRRSTSARARTTGVSRPAGPGWHLGTDTAGMRCLDDQRFRAGLARPQPAPW